MVCVMRPTRRKTTSPQADSRAPYAPRVSIVTGGGSGIGAALATELVARGGTVVLADIDGPAVEAVAARLTLGGPGRATARVLDVTDRAALTDLIDGTVRMHGRLDLMCNNAGILVTGPFAELTERHWDTALAVNLRAVVDGTRAAYRHMVRAGHGAILNTGSLAGLIPGASMTPYVTSKYAVVGFTQALRAEAHRAGVRVCVLCPGFTETPLIDAPFEPTASYRTGSFRTNARLLQPRFMTPQRVALAALEGVARDRGVITVGTSAAVLSRAQRFAPKVVEVGNRVHAWRSSR